MQQEVLPITIENIINVNNEKYQISNTKYLKKGDLLLDIRKNSFSYGIHDGKFKNRIAVKNGFIVEGVEIQYLKKLIKKRN